MTRLGSSTATDWRFPRAVAGVGVLVEAGADLGVGADRLLAGTGLGSADLSAIDTVVTGAQELRVVRNLLAAAPGVTGAEVGSRYRVTTFGVLGFALLTSETVGAAMELALRYMDLSFTFALPAAELVGDEVVVTLDDRGLPPDVAPFLVERDLTAIHGALVELHPGRVPLRRVTLAHRAPGAADPLVSVLGLEPTWGAPAHTLVYDVAVVAAPLPQADARTRAMSEAMCRDVVSRRRARQGIDAEVRVLIAQRLGRDVSVAAVAHDLGLSPRTLRRRLVVAGTSYQALLDEVRESLAEELLLAGLGVEDVALRLGYAEAASLIHAFRRWKQITPTAWLRATDDIGGRGATSSARSHETP